MIIKEFKKLVDEIKKFLEDETSGHDYYHCQRVFNNAMYIQKHEGGDMYVIGASALIHDILRPWEKKTGKSHFGKEALKIIKKVLQKVKVPKDKIEPILKVIELHDIYDWTDKVKDKSIELRVIQDADRIDSIGAVGIARTFAFGGHHDRPIYLPGENLEFTKDFVENLNRRTSTIAHFYEKLLKLKQNMNTKTGMKIAGNRHKVMENFLREFFREWEGKFK